MAELEPRNFLQPCLLLLLREQPDHGYDLAARLRPMHDGDGDAGGVYRSLRGLEKQGLVRSEWQTSEMGPARRTYYITRDGIAYLDAQAIGLLAIHEALHVFLERYNRLVAADRQAVHSSLHPALHERNGDDRRVNGRARGNGLHAPRTADRSARR